MRPPHCEGRRKNSRAHHPAHLVVWGHSVCEDGVMVDKADFGMLCGLVAELTNRVRTIALGAQGLAVDEQLAEIGRQVEVPRVKVRG